MRDGKPCIPDRIVVIWTDAVMNSPNEVGVRGMGGRIMFYEAGQDETVKVDGSLTVYAYENNGTNGASVPTRKYAFLAEQLERHYSKSQLGHSYSFWLPWGEVGGPPRQLTLIARFEPRGGGAVLSEAITQLLPGAAVTPVVRQRSEGVEIRHLSEGQVTPASHVSPQAAPVTHAALQPQQREMETITIEVPPAFARRPAPSGASPAAPTQAQTGSTSRAKAAASRPLSPPSTGGLRPRGSDSQPGKRRALAPPRPRPAIEPPRRRPRPAGWPSAVEATPAADPGQTPAPTTH